MNSSVFLVDVRAQTFTPANPTARALSATWATAEQGWPLTQLLPSDAAASCDGAARWLRLPDGSRLWTRISQTPLPEDSGRALLMLNPAGLAKLDAQLLPQATVHLDAFRSGTATQLQTLGGLCESLQSTLDLALARVLQIDGTAWVECVARGDAAVAAMARQAPVAGEETVSALGAGVVRQRLRDLGVQSTWRCELKGSDQSYVLELLAYGAADFNSAPMLAFLAQRMPWLAQQLEAAAGQQQNQLLASGLQGAASAAFITDAQGHFVWVNPAFCKRYGYAPEDVIGRTPSLLQSGKHGALYYERLWSALNAGRPWAGETCDRTADGQFVTVRQVISPIRQRGRISHFLSIHADISADTQLAQIADLQRGTDVLTGVLTQAALVEHCRELLNGATQARRTPALMLMVIQTAAGTAPTMDAESLAFSRAVLGERIRSVVGDDIAVGTLSGFDFAFLLPHPGVLDLRLQQQLQDLLSAPLPLLGETLQLQCRFACAQFPHDGGDFDALRRSAEAQLLEEGGPAHAVIVRPALAVSESLPPPR